MDQYPVLDRSVPKDFRTRRVHFFILKLKEVFQEEEFPEKDMNQFYLTKRRKEVGAVR